LLLRKSISFPYLGKVSNNEAAHFRCRKLTRVIFIIGSPDLINKFSLVEFMGDSFLNILNFGSSYMFNESLHLSFIDLSVMIDVDRVEESIELLLRESIGLTKLGKVSNNKAAHF